jgi:hypothetical protein
VNDAEGELSLDTGSGPVKVARIRASSVTLDTGSRTVTGSDMTVDKLSLDTGSGRVELRAVRTRGDLGHGKRVRGAAARKRCRSLDRRLRERQRDHRCARRYFVVSGCAPFSPAYFRFVS